MNNHSAREANHAGTTTPVLSKELATAVSTLQLAPATLTTRPDLTIPRKPDYSQLPATPLNTGDRLKLRLRNYRGELSEHYHHFTVGSVRASAKRYHEDEQEALDRAKAAGHPLVFATAEPSVISSHPETPVERKELLRGQLVLIEGTRYQLLQAPNNNVSLLALE